MQSSIGVDDFVVALDELPDGLFVVGILEFLVRDLLCDICPRLSLSIGEVVGIISTGKIPKNPVVREAAFLTRIFDESAEEVWQELSYAVPASKILEVVGDSLPQ